MDEFLKKVDQVAIVDTSKLNMFLLKEKALEFTKLLSENPNFTQFHICKMLGTSDSTMRRIRNDLGMSSPFRHDVKRKGHDGKKKGTANKTKGEIKPLPDEPKANILEGKSFYCTDYSKVLSSKSSQNYICRIKSKDVLGSGVSIFNNKDLTTKNLKWKEKEEEGMLDSEGDSPGDEELDKVLNRG